MTAALAFLRLAWPYLLALSIGFGAAWHWRTGDLNALELANLKDTAKLNDEWRDKEQMWRQSTYDAEKGFLAERATWDATRNRGPGASVRVCQPSREASTAAASSPAAGEPVSSPPAAGLVPTAVPEGTEVGPMLRLVIAEGERVSAQLRAVLAERQGLSTL